MKRLLALVEMIVSALVLALPGGPATYDIGPGLACESISAFPWETLQPGDTVNIHGKSTAYREFLPLSQSGTALAPIVVQGVPGPFGEPAILDGETASIRQRAPLWSTQIQTRGLVIVSYRKDQPYGTIPSWITVSNLTIRNAHPTWSFRSYADVTTQFARNAAGLYVERGQNIVVSGCSISGCANGLFVASNSDLTKTGVPAGLSKNVYVSNCTIRGNGVVNSFLQHDWYSECDGLVCAGCTVGPPAAGALGCALKDRSAGTVIKSSTITGGGHLLDLVEAQDGYALIAQNPLYRKSYVTGCLLVNGPGQSTSPIYYGSDSIAAQARKGTLCFSGNVVVNTADQTVTPGHRWRTVLFTLTDNEEKLWAANNVFANQSMTSGKPATQLVLADQFGNLQFGANFVSPGWLPSRDQETTPPGTRFTGTIVGADKLLPIQASP